MFAIGSVPHPETPSMPRARQLRPSPAALGTVWPATGGSWLVYVLGDHPRTAAISRALGVGFDQVRMADGAPLVTAVRAARPDLVILADDCPSLDLVRALRASPGIRDLPIILLGASCRPRDIAAAFEVGVSDYICQAFCPAQLRARALSLLLSGSGSG